MQTSGQIGRLVLGLYMLNVFAVGRITCNPVEGSAYVFHTQDGITIEEWIMVTPTEQIITLRDGTRVVYDYSTGFVVTKENDICYISTFDRKTLTSPTQEEFDKMNEGRDNVTVSYEKEYIVDKVRHVDPTILSKTSEQMCAKSEIFWLSNASKGQLSRRQKRDCFPGCRFQCSCCPWDCEYECSYTCTW